jgi:glycosyltransferase involved in cell wall biosynthesis
MSAAGSALRHVAINGWFLGQLGAGTGQYLHHMLAALPAASPGVRWSVLVPPEAAPLDLPGVEWVRLPLPALPRPLRKLYWEQVAVPRAARRLGAGVLWVPYWAAPLWQPVPTVVTVHDLIPLLLPEYRGGIPGRLYTALVSASARRAAAIVTVSEAGKRDVVARLGVAEANVHAVPHGPNQEGAPPPTPAQLDAARARYHLPERYFLYLGGFDARKNVGTLLRAYCAYLERGGDPAVYLVIAGKLPARDSAFAPDPQKAAAELGLSAQVHFCGWVEEADKPALYALATAYFFPSTYEGFGMTILEAMAAGTPVVTSEQ